MKIHTIRPTAVDQSSSHHSRCLKMDESPHDVSARSRCWRNGWWQKEVYGFSVGRRLRRAAFLSSKLCESAQKRTQCALICCVHLRQDGGRVDCYAELARRRGYRAIRSWMRSIENRANRCPTSPIWSRIAESRSGDITYT